jgi:hypothetical protein
MLPSEGKFAKICLPYLPVTLSFEGSFPVGHALVDTGADMTLLPMDMRKYIGVDLDESRSITIGSAGGGGFVAIPSKEKIKFKIEKKGYRPIEWQGTVFFAPRQPLVLLGHHQCLEQLNIRFRGKERTISVEKAWFQRCTLVHYTYHSPSPMKAEIIERYRSSFEQCARHYQGIECWSARELQPLLGYENWQNFREVIERAVVY